MTNKKTVIIIAGPTAVGKTAAAIKVAQQFKTEIISADSRQCYKELNIGVARPSADELKEVPHHFIASHSIKEKITAATFEQYALEKVYGLFKKFDTVVMVGGTGLYIKAFCEGMDTIPEVPADIHNEIIERYKSEGLLWLQNEVALSDPQFFASGENQNPQRLMRALEVSKTTGKSILAYRSGVKKQRDFNIIKIALEVPKEQLQQNIDLRVDAMMQQGLLQEVENLVPFQDLNALQTVGYRELFDFLNGKLTLTEAVALIKRNTRHYAKRQLTWFKKDKDFHWFHPAEEAYMEFLKSSLLND